MNECDSHKLATMSLIVCVAHVFENSTNFINILMNTKSHQTQKYISTRTSIQNLLHKLMKQKFWLPPVMV